MDFSFTSDQQDLRELAAKILSDATTLERTKKVVGRRRRLRPRPVVRARRGRDRRHLGARVGRRRRARVPRDVHRAGRGRPHRGTDPRARGPGTRRARAGRVRWHRRARRRGRRHPHRHRRTHRGGRRRVVAVDLGVVRREAHRREGVRARRPRSPTRIVVSATRRPLRGRPVVGRGHRRARGHHARRADGTPRPARRARRPSSPVPMASRGCSSARRPPWPSRCRVRRRPRSTSRRRT